MWQNIFSPIRTLYSTPTRLNALVALWISISCNLPFFQKIITLNPDASVWFVLATFVLLWAYLNVFLQLICWNVLGKPLLWIMLFVSTSTAYCIYSFGVGIDVGQIQNLMETDLKESTGLFTLGTLLFYAVVFFPVAYLIWSAPHDTRRLWPKLRERLLAVLLSLLAMGAVAGVYYAEYAATFREHRDLRDYVTPHNFIAGLQKYYKQHQPLTVVPFQTHVPMLTWFSPAFTAAHADQVRCMQQQKHAELSHDNIFHSVLGLLAIQTTVKNPALDLSDCSAVNL